MLTIVDYSQIEKLLTEKAQKCASRTEGCYGSRTMAAIYMHNQKLYIIEGTAPDNEPGPELFQQSFGWIDQNGNNIRYESLYHHAFPAPPRGNPPGEITQFN
jgi:hypothetical protein